VVEESVRDHGSISSKEPKVDGDVSGRHVGGRVGFVHLLIEDTSVVGDVEDVVCLAEPIKGSITGVWSVFARSYDRSTNSRVDGKVASQPRIGVVDTQDHETGQEHSDSSVDDVEVRDDQRVRVLEGQI
jgi:hypothetical protein